MTDIPQNHSSSPYPFSVQGFLKSLYIIVITTLILFIAEKLSHYFIANSGPWIGLSVITIVISTWLLVFRRQLSRVLGAPVFIITCLNFIGIATIMGTLSVIQGSDLNWTGSLGSKIFQVLQLDNVYHSWWYLSLLSLIGTSVTIRSLSKKFTRTNIPFHLVHLGMVVIIAGFFINFLWSWQGFLDVEVGTDKNLVKVYERNMTKFRGSLQLPFFIRLNKFSTEKSPPEYRIKLWENHGEINPHSGSNFGAGAKDDDQKQLAIFRLEQGEIHRIAKTDMYFRLNEFYPNFGFIYAYPDRIDTIAPVDAGIMLELIIGPDRPQLQLRADQNSALDEPHIGAALEFYWDIPAEVAALPLISQTARVDTSLKRIVFVGASEEVCYIYANGVRIEKLLSNNEYRIPGNENFGFYYQFIFPDASLITALPGSLSDELVNPVAKVEIWSKGKPGSFTAYLYSGKDGTSGFHQIPGTNYRLGLGTEGNDRTHFKSDISVIDLSGKEIKRAEVGTSHEMKYDRYNFNQFQDGSENSEYPGLLVTKRAGLNVIFGGIFLVILSALMLIFQSWFRGWQATG